MAWGDEIYEQEERIKVTKQVNEGVLNKLINYINSKDTHKREDIISKILELLLEEMK